MNQSEDLLRRRYGTSGAWASTLWNETISVMLSHRSVRAYLPDAVPEGTLEILIAAAQSAPTSSNMQTWSVVAVQDVERKKRLAFLANRQRHIEQCPLFLVWLADHARIRGLGAHRNRKSEGLDYLETFLVAALDAAFAAQNCVNAAESLGLGTVYIGGIRNHPEDVAKEIGLPPHVFATFGMCIGYADPIATAGRDVKPRLPQAAVLHRERYQDQEPRVIDEYDDTLRSFQVQQRMKVEGWIEKVLKRTEGAHSLHGRDVNREVINRMGFELK